jgi:hypothetical protein
MEQARRPALEDHVHWSAPMGARVLIKGSCYQWPLGPFSSLVIDQRSTLLPLIDGFRKNTRQSFEDTSLSLSIRRLGRRIGIGSALRRAVAKLLKHYAQSFVRLVEAACCSGSDCYVLVLETCRPSMDYGIRNKTCHSPLRCAPDNGQLQ